MIYIKIAILVAFLFFFMKLTIKHGVIEMNCWTISYVYLLIELYAIISFTVSEAEVCRIAYPLALGTMCAAIAGYYFSRNVFFKTEDNNIETQLCQIDSDSSRYAIVIPGLLLFFFIMIVIGTFRYQGIPPIVESFTALLKGGYSREDAVGLTEARRFISKDHYFGGSYRGQGLTKVLQLTGWPLLCSTTLGLYLQNKKKSILALFIVFMIFGIIYLAGDGTRSPALILILICLISYAQKKKVNLVGMAKYGIYIPLFLILISAVSIKQYSVFEGGVSVKTMFEAFQGVLDRILLGNSGCDIIAINYISDGIIPIQKGMIHIQQFFNALPGVSMSYMTFSYLLGQMAGGSATSYYSTTYLGIAYADFGFFGALITYFLIGSLCAFAVHYFKPLTERNNPLQEALYACLTWEISYIFVKSLVGCLAEIAVIISLYCIMKLLCIRRGQQVDSKVWNG